MEGLGSAGEVVVFEGTFHPDLIHAIGVSGQWVAFGGGALAAEGIRDEQRKFIKYNHLVANLLIFHNVRDHEQSLGKD